MLNDSEMTDIAIKAVAEAQQARKPIELYIRGRVDCFGGKLLVVSGKFPDDNSRFDNYLFFTGDKWEFIFNSMELVKRLDQGIGTPAALRALQNVFSFNAIAGMIAIALTATIITLIFRSADPGNVKVPEILANSLTTILGFYFGSQVGRGPR